MKSKLTLLSVLGVLLFVGNSFSQDNSNVQMFKSLSTRAYVGGNYVQLPSQDQLKYQNPNKTTRVIHTSIGDIVVPPNVRPFPDAATQSEVDAKTMSGNGSTMYASWNSFGPSTFWGTGYCFTNNEGVSWTGSKQTFGGNNGDPGPWIWPAGSTWAGRLGLSVIGSSQLAAGYSNNNGVTWNGPVNMGGTSVDKNLSAVDNNPTSPFFGRAYTVWTDFAGANINRIVGAYTTDGGVSWTGYGPVSPAPTSGHHCQGCDVAVGPNGVVYVVWGHCMTNGQNSTEINLGFAKSLDGGVTWTVSTNTAVPTNGIRTASLFNGIRASGFPRLAVDRTGGSQNGWIYAVMAEKNIAPATDVADICLCRSTDGGTTWTHTRVNQDTPGNGKYQYEPAVCVDPAGGVNVSYYDQRNTSGTQAEYWMSRSLNGGNSWTDVAVSDHSFTPAPIGGLAGGYQGDYTGITASTSKVWPFWADNSSGIYQVWTSGISTGPPPAHDYAMGPFLSFPQSPLLINTAYTIKSEVVNAGSSNETNVPITFYINGTLTNTTNKSLNAGQVDSVSNVWTPTVAGTYTLKYISNLSTDLNRLNDTVQATVSVLPSLPALCEQYEGSFPPTGWSGGGTYLIGRTGVSGFGIGNGCAEYNSWSAPTGDVEDLFTLTFPATGVHDSIVVDLAYASYPAGGITQDSLIITASTNGGSTYTSVVRLGPLQLATAPAQSTEFTPTASQWKKVAFVLPSGTNKIDFQGKSQFGNDIFFDSTCIKPGIVGISNNGNNIPRVYSLAQNYPNPFNPTTTISFGLPKAGLVKLVVYDILGRVVSTLVNEHRNAGMYNIAFDASNISSGVYFYKIESGDFSSIKKMVLVK